MRHGIGSWRASRTSALLLSLLVASCDPEKLYGSLPAGLRREMYERSCCGSAGLTCVQVCAERQLHVGVRGPGERADGDEEAGGVETEMAEQERRRGEEEGKVDEQGIM